MNYSKTFIYILAVFMCSCSGDSESYQPPGYFFNLKSFFIEETERLSAENLEVNKTVERNGEKSNSILKIDFAKEFKVFSYANIDLSALKDEYQSDTLKTEQGFLLLYLKKKKDLRTSKLQVHCNSNYEPYLIQIDVEDNTPLYSIKQFLEYRPDLGYNITSTQTVPYMSDENISINVRFIR